MIGKIKHIVVIESLTESDGNFYTGKALYEDAIEKPIRYYSKDFTHRFHKVSSKIEFNEIIAYYQTNAIFFKEGILLHFEIHGDTELTGLVLSNGDLISWAETVDLLRPINIDTCNSLFITMGVCYGRYLYRGVDSSKKSPYSGYISSSKSISPKEIHESFSVLFEHLLDNGNIIESYLKLDKLKTNFYYKDSKSTFEDAFRSVVDKLHNTPELKEKLLKESMSEVEQKTGSLLDFEESEIIFDNAVNELYNLRKKVFVFEN